MDKKKNVVRGSKSDRKSTRRSSDLKKMDYFQMQKYVEKYCNKILQKN